MHASASLKKKDLHLTPCWNQYPPLWPHNQIYDLL
jgi:hypothetical protein